MADERHESKLARWAKDGKPGTEPVPAATVILLRDGPRGLESLMLRRNSKIAFGGMWVFPGGRVDPADAHGLAQGDELGAARQAAVREAEEEAGLDIPLDALIPFSHWTPPAITPRRFLTWFFLAAAPSAEVRIDDGEIREHAWMQPDEALERRDAGDIELAPPTWVSLFDLRGCESIDAAFEASRHRPPREFETHIAIVDDEPMALWQGDAGWSDTDPSRPGARHRLHMKAAGWRFEREL
jgi:8-oxo-dGTP pyrophosphatase MutT (NUDIX family)